MKFKSLLAVTCLMASVSASAVYPIYFRDTVDENGHMTFPKNDDGTPAFNEDGSITLTRIEGDGVYFRTKYIGGDPSDPTQYPATKYAYTGECSNDFTVLAFDYKSSLFVDNLVVFQHEFGANNYPEFQNFVDIANGAMFTVADDYQTVYMIIRRGITPWGTQDKNYFWISFNNTVPGWVLTVKNIRLMTLDEASAECKGSNSKVILDALTLPNSDLTQDFDDNMDCNIYSVSGGNPILASAQLLKPLPTGVTAYKFDYKVAGEPINVKLYMHKKTDYTEMTVIPDNFTLEPCEGDPYEEGWKTFSYDFAEKIAEIGFAQNFGDNHFIWVQFPGMTEDQMMWIKNPRWVDPTYDEDNSGVANIEAVAADGRTYNLMGVEIKGEFAPGIYVRDGKKFIVK